MQSVLMKQPASLSQKPPQPSNNNSKLNKWYRDCSKLPLDCFIDCLVDGDLTALIISGNPTEKELSDAWEHIFLEYCELTSSVSHNASFGLLKEINDLKAKIIIVNNTVEYLSIRWDADLVNILNQLSLNCTLKSEDEQYQKKLRGVLARSKQWYTRLETAKKELEESHKSNKIERSYFDEMLNAMSTMNKYQVDSRTLTVSRFCKALARMAKQAEMYQIKALKNAS